ncbi:hypothetical protein F4677DRAFT_369955 [Hypoxylon crocopeplum]|nr:hypothetical protein F4677DRAFT_369955 [Hypoxylon crocopeplum]
MLDDMMDASSLDVEPGSEPQPMDESASQRRAPSLTGNQLTNIRSCLVCRKRKVKCDKQHPCENCTRAKVECVFPPPGRARRHGSPDPELMSRLRRLEGVVNTLGSHFGEDTIRRVIQESAASHGKTITAEQPTSPGIIAAAATAQDSTSGPPPQGPSPRSQQSSDAGRLVKEGGKDRYLGNSFWASLQLEVETEESSVDGWDHDAQSVSSHNPVSDYDILFPRGSTTSDLKEFHPTSADERWQMWALYLDNVQPMLGVFHLMSLEHFFRLPDSALQTVPKSIELSMFCIYYGAVTSIDHDDCQTYFSQERSVLLGRYRFCIERLLVETRFIETDDVFVLQAFCTYLIVLRRHDPFLSWKMCGLAIRLAQSLGIHRDGSGLGLSAFESEIRRRIAWQLCNIDAPASEDFACDPSILEMSSFDVRMPMNINTSDLQPGSIELPTEKQGFTDSTFLLVHVEVTCLWREVFDSRRRAETEVEKAIEAMTDVEKDAWIEQRGERLEQRYLRHCSLSVPLQWVTIMYMRFMLLELKLNVHKPLKNVSRLSAARRDELLVCSIECVEILYRLQNDRRSEKWAWYFKSYAQWHALAFVLHELAQPTHSRHADRAWRAVERTMACRWECPSENYRGSHQWNTMLRMLDKARARRSSGSRARSNPSTVSHESRLSFTGNGVFSNEVTPTHPIHAAQVPYKESSAPSFDFEALYGFNSSQAPTSMMCSDGTGAMDNLSNKATEIAEQSRGVFDPSAMDDSHGDNYSLFFGEKSLGMSELNHTAGDFEMSPI